MGESFTTNIDCGGISSGTSISSNDTVQKLIKSMIHLPPDPNTLYSSTNLGTWSSLNDVDTFFANYNHNNRYDGLALGNYVTINDGTYNAVWEIAGFDMEHNQLAADNTTYDNGYGICLIPKTKIGDESWNDDDTLTGGYMTSYIRTSYLVDRTWDLRNVLGSHLVNRNVLLSSSVNSSKYSSAYTWTTNVCTLMSVGQCTGTFASHRNKYDDGEANYKLPLFNYKSCSTREMYWLRCIRGYGSYCTAWYIGGDGSIEWTRVTASIGVRPLIYLR